MSLTTAQLQQRAKFARQVREHPLAETIMNGYGDSWPLLVSDMQVQMHDDDIHLHDVPRPLFDLFSGEEMHIQPRDGDPEFWTKIVSDGYSAGGLFPVACTLYTNEPPVETKGA